MQRYPFEQRPSASLLIHPLWLMDCVTRSPTLSGFFLFIKIFSKKCNLYKKRIVYLSKHLNFRIMKNYFFDLLDQVTPANEEHKDIFMCFLGFFPLFLCTVGGLLLTLILMR